MVEEIIITFLVCVVLPIGIVWLVTRARMQKNKLTSDIIMAAIEKNSEINIEEFAKSLGNSESRPKCPLTPEERNIRRLQTGCACLIIGIGLAIFYFTESVVPHNICFYAAIVLAGLGIGSMVAYFVGKGKDKKVE